MDEQLGIVYARMLEKGVAVIDNTTGQPQWADPSAAMMGKIDDWVQRHKTTTDTSNPIQALLEREAKKGRKIQPVSTEPDAASN